MEWIASKNFATVAEFDVVEGECVPFVLTIEVKVGTHALAYTALVGPEICRSIFHSGLTAP